MKKAVIIVTVFLFIFLNINITLSEPSSLIEFFYDFNKTIETDDDLHYTSSVLLVINTPIETTCYYSIVNTSNPSNTFDTNFGTRHEKEIEGLDDGLHKYFIKCDSNATNPVMETSFKTKSTVSAEISISEDDPLTAGTYDINLQTSSYIIGSPQLEYSFDGIVYNPVPLTGSGKNWRGHLIFGENIGETILSFQFKATDLDGKEGTTITSQSVYEIDTEPPGIITSLDAVGYKGEIELEWLKKENIDHYNIYRSENENVGYSDYLDQTTNTKYTDLDVEKGKTYYYRVVAVDEADNMGALSREVSATALLSSSQSSSSGLSPNLIGKVDNLLTEISLFKEDVDILRLTLDAKSEAEKEIFNDLELEKEYANVLSELESTRRDTERFKEQDLSEPELNSKLNSVRLKIDIMRKKVPESVTIISENSIKKDLTEVKIEELVLEYSQNEFSEEKVRKSISETLTLIEENSISIDSSIQNVEITFIDGTKTEKSIIKDNINANIEEIDNTRLVLYVPKEVAESVSKMSFNIQDYEIIKEDPVVAFNTDVKKLVYTLDKHVSTNKLNDIIISPVHFYEEGDRASLITGYSISDFSITNYSYVGYILLGIVLLLLILYFIKIKIRSKNKELSKITELVKIANEFKKDKEKEELAKIYKEIKELYQKLDPKDKKRIYKKIKKLHEK